MRRQNSENNENELKELNQGLKEALKEVPAKENREKSYEGIDDTSQEEKAKKKKLTAGQIVTRVLVGVLTILFICIGAFIGLRMSGKKSLMASEDINMETPQIDGQEISVEDNGDLVVYNGQKYCYNHNMITVLLMGIDQTQDERLEYQEEGLLIGNGQADTVILAAMDVETGKTSLINISRDSLVDVDVYTSSGNYGGTKNIPVCLAYAYGKGEKGGSLNVARSVSRLLYGVPVGSYAAINLSAITVMNDAIGGVEVEVLEDLTYADSSLYVGNTVTLMGSLAETYVRSRDAYYGGAGSNSMRMERQKQYLSSFAAKTLEKTRADVTVPLTLFDIASEYMVTDLNAAKVSYLVSILNKVGLEESSFVTVPGEAVLNENGYAEYIVDDKALYEMILDIFYEKVNN